METFLQRQHLITKTPHCAGTWCGVVAGRRTPGQKGVRFHPGTLQLQLHLLPSRALAKREGSSSAAASAASATNKGAPEGAHDSAFVPCSRTGVTTISGLTPMCGDTKALTYALQPPGSDIKVTQNLALGTTEIAQVIDRPGASPHAPCCNEGMRSQEPNTHLSELGIASVLPTRALLCEHDSCRGCTSPQAPRHVPVHETEIVQL